MLLKKLGQSKEVTVVFLSLIMPSFSTCRSWLKYKVFHLFFKG